MPSSPLWNPNYWEGKTKWDHWNIDEIQIYGRERIHNIIEPIDEIEIISPNRPDNVIYPSDKIQIMGKKPSIDASNPLLEINPNNDDDKFKERKIKMDILKEEYN